MEISPKIVKIDEKKVKMSKCHYHCWNHHRKYIQISANMPSIGLDDGKKRLLNLNNLENKKRFCDVKINGAL